MFDDPRELPVPLSWSTPWILWLLSPANSPVDGVLPRRAWRTEHLSGDLRKSTENPHTLYTFIGAGNAGTQAVPADA